MFIDLRAQEHPALGHENHPYRSLGCPKGQNVLEARKRAPRNNRYLSVGNIRKRQSVLSVMESASSDLPCGKSRSKAKE